jgi:hypothetical protein
MVEVVADAIGGIGRDEGTTEPTISQNGVVVKPVSVEEIRGTSKGNSEEHTDICGNTQVKKQGDANWHVTVEAMVLKSQFEELKQMRPQDEPVRIVSDGFTGNVTFDRFTFKQKEDFNTVETEVDGEVREEPLISVQLQSRAENND